MNNKVLKKLPFLLFAITLFIMYGTNIGIPGIAQYWKYFELLDMQPFYSVDTVITMLRNIGFDGVRHYLYYFVVDFVFIILLFLIQIQISKSALFNMPKIRKFLILCAAVRGFFDLLEDLLLSLIITKILPISMVTFTSGVTRLKFMGLFIWGGVLLMSICSSKMSNDKRKKEY